MKNSLWGDVVLTSFLCLCEYDGHPAALILQMTGRVRIVNHHGADTLFC